MDSSNFLERCMTQIAARSIKVCTGVRSVWPMRQIGQQPEDPLRRSSMMQSSCMTWEQGKDCLPRPSLSRLSKQMQQYPSATLNDALAMKKMLGVFGPGLICYTSSLA
mmetsp:Transcript_157839/g.290835  ORF Transcript_157839/g.290835 Transcript_157839/m.290835 type:complete len:108 (+) Transcript_157839:150-473(+)